MTNKFLFIIIVVLMTATGAFIFVNKDSEVLEGDIASLSYTEQ